MAAKVTKKSIDLVKNVGADALGLFLGVPTGTAMALVGDMLKRRIVEARDILLNQIRAGDIDVIEAAASDEKVDILYRYYIAARDGAGRANLHLLARVIVGLAGRDRLYADEFNRYAVLLSQLTRDQIFVIGRYYAHEKSVAGEQDDVIRSTSAWKNVIKEMVPTHFATEGHIQSVCAQLIGAGLLFQIGAFGNNVYRLTPLVEEIANLADFEAALASANA